MSAPVGNQIDGLRVLARRVNARQMSKAFAMRESEAQHLIDMLTDAAETLERAWNGERID